MATVQVQTNIAGDLLDIQATGKLGYKLAQCKTTADVIAVFGAIQKALEALNYARMFNVQGASQEAAWREVDTAQARSALSLVDISLTEKTSVTITSLDTIT